MDDSYKVFIDAGKEELISYKKDIDSGKNEKWWIKSEKEPATKGTTGICFIPHPFIDQLIDLNSYVNTYASTNTPDDPFFQAMFCDGWIHRSLISQQLLGDLIKNNISYSINSVKIDPDCGKTYLNLIDAYSTENAFSKKIAHDTIDEWWFSGREQPDGLLIAKRFQKKMKDSYFPNKFRDTVKKVGFVEAFEHLDTTDLQEIEKFKKEPLYNHKAFAKYLDVPEKDYMALPANGESGGYGIYFSGIKEQVLNGNVLHFSFVNQYDPTDRNLYSDLVNIFIKNKK